MSKLALHAVLAAAALVLGASLPSSSAQAADGTIYHWVTDDGTFAFSDDEKNIPRRYRDRVQERQLKELGEYERFTPVVKGAAATPDAPALPPVSAPPPGYVAPQASGNDREGRPAVSIRTGGANAPIVDIRPGDDPEPIVIEKRRYRAEGSAVTRTNTIIRQGDRVLTIIKPQPNEFDVNDFADESELER